MAGQVILASYWLTLTNTLFLLVDSHLYSLPIGQASGGHQDADAGGLEDRQEPSGASVPSSLQHCTALHLRLSQVFT